ncbi:nickel pincer cofactor biosynthesis protein LarB [Abyssisolibacter fermentans]|uniref:nickel pincer cofactor biosynthesis protein LarB n=1 Tax=Abyssisolibacter fermentans TaxID=1766203 RepID=UPI00082D4435|nr:nickel pincer cofactor biosynthesis protein LarB [Abyssisolibacter fermentans]
MNEDSIRQLLKHVKEGNVNVDEALNVLKDLPFEDIGYAKIDHHRQIRNGYPEVIYCEGKTPEQVRGIVERMLKKDTCILATRADKDKYDAIKDLCENIKYYNEARIIVVNQKDIKKSEHKILVVTGGTSDIPVAEEAAITAETFGNTVERLYDVGVAGIHRLLSNVEKLHEARVIIAVAGMEGALASVVGGLVDKPVIAVPTSIGYGASLNGIAALLAMLNSCASGIGVVNIDNGFGAGYLASTINRL